MKKTINIAIIGLGTVGKGVYEILKNDYNIISERLIYDYKVSRICSRSKKDFCIKDIESNLVKWSDNADDIINDNNIDLIIELIGGTDIALEIARKSLKAKKHYITANKALIALHGSEISKLAEENNLFFGYEASVAGGIPIIKNIKEGLIANQINEINAILNGTSNFILTKMEKDKEDFAKILKIAQDLGYAELDPTFDIGGIDASHKIAIISSILTKSLIDFNKLYIEGIDKIDLQDIIAANEFGYKIKSLSKFKIMENDELLIATYPALIQEDNILSHIDDSFNAIVAKTNNVDDNISIGRGAGSKETASAVIADIGDFINNYNHNNSDNRSSYLYGVKYSNLISAKYYDINNLNSKFYIRFDITKINIDENKKIIFDNIEDDVIDKFIVKSNIDENNNIDSNQEILSYHIITNNINFKDINNKLHNLLENNNIISAKLLIIN